MQIGQIHACTQYSVESEQWQSVRVITDEQLSLLNIEDTYMSGTMPEVMAMTFKSNSFDIPNV